MCKLIFTKKLSCNVDFTSVKCIVLQQFCECAVYIMYTKLSTSVGRLFRPPGSVSIIPHDYSLLVVGGVLKGGIGCFPD